MAMTSLASHATRAIRGAPGRQMPGGMAATIPEGLDEPLGAQEKINRDKFPARQNELAG